MNINTLTGFEKGRKGFSISLSIWFNNYKKSVIMSFNVILV